ncbi:11S globulin seed storage protein Ana o 2.0101-like [Prosopis cineraria]|uniref:11S globulin seed storage protein Ana o 2.0101-like n=1 Tax=Prosopis cineraria TaxID=364024 RepID=UPI00241031FF|nr:11S globulin seed storage protein Ana o 2.0101-like [Prosopis cineraria]
MELEELRAETGEKVFEGEGGAYYVWSSSDMACSNVAAAWLQLQPAGFALPHYADSHKLGYVLQGTDGLVGMVLPNTTKEIVLSLKKGDVIPVPKGAMSWWFNPNHSQQPITIVFLVKLLLSLLSLANSPTSSSLEP